MSLGNTSASSLVKSAASLQTAVQNYQDQVQALEFANSAYTDEAYSAYSAYLSGRINALNSGGGIVNASKALTLTRTLEGATHSNTSASIQRENIQMLAGNATPTDKYNVIVSQYQRAMGNGDLTLAQSLENQAYSLSQTIQQQAQQAADARATLAKAASSANITYQGEVVSNLNEALKSFTATAKYGSEKELNADLAKYANDPATKAQLQALGVNIQGSQPNYWDVVSGIAGAMYNHKVLQAQAEAGTNPLLARTYASQAQDYLTGASKFQTLGGSLTALEIQQAQQDPSMFAYDNTKGTYQRTIQSGYQYIAMQNEDGTTGQQLVPKYSGMAQRKAFNDVVFLTPTETTQMTKLGLNFSENKNQTTGAGVQAQLTSNTPDWLRNLVGENGLVNIFPDSGNNVNNNGFIEFKAASSTGKGDSFYTLATDDRGLSGLYEHTADGNTGFMGGDYGFNAGAVQLLVNKGQQVQQQIVQAQAKAQQALQIQQQQAQAQLQAQQTALRVAPPNNPSPIPHTVNPQLPTFNPQPQTFNPQPATQYTSNVQGVPLNRQALPGIHL